MSMLPLVAVKNIITR